MHHVDGNGAFVTTYQLHHDAETGAPVRLVRHAALHDHPQRLRAAREASPRYYHRAYLSHHAVFDIPPPGHKLHSGQSQAPFLTARVRDVHMQPLFDVPGTTYGGTESRLDEHNAQQDTPLDTFVDASITPPDMMVVATDTVFTYTGERLVPAHDPAHSSQRRSTLHQSTSTLSLLPTTGLTVDNCALLRHATDASHRTSGVPHTHRLARRVSGVTHEHHHIDKAEAWSILTAERVSPQVDVAAVSLARLYEFLTDVPESALEFFHTLFPNGVGYPDATLVDVSTAPNDTTIPLAVRVQGRFINVWAGVGSPLAQSTLLSLLDTVPPAWEFYFNDLFFSRLRNPSTQVMETIIKRTRAAVLDRQYNGTGLLQSERMPLDHTGHPGAVMATRLAALGHLLGVYAVHPDSDNDLRRATLVAETLAWLHSIAIDDDSFFDLHLLCSSLNAIGNAFLNESLPLLIDHSQRRPSAMLDPVDAVQLRHTASLSLRNYPQAQDHLTDIATNRILPSTDRLGALSALMHQSLLSESTWNRLSGIESEAPLDAHEVHQRDRHLYARDAVSELLHYEEAKEDSTDSATDADTSTQEQDYVRGYAGIVLDHFNNQHGRRPSTPHAKHSRNTRPTFDAAKLVKEQDRFVRSIVHSANQEYADKLRRRNVFDDIVGGAKDAIDTIFDELGKATKEQCGLLEFFYPVDFSWKKFEGSSDANIDSRVIISNSVTFRLRGMQVGRSTLKTPV